MKVGEANGQSPFSIGLDLFRGIPVVQARGEIDIAAVPNLAGVLDEATTAATGPRRVVADLRGVTFMDATGLGVLLNYRNRLRELGEELCLVIPAAQEWPVKSLLSLTGLDRAFQVYTNLDAAFRRSGTIHA